MNRSTNALKVGELAKRTGVSVRTLHYYNEIGLLSPSQRTRADYRLYTSQDVVRLQQIVSLRQLGFSLTEIKDCLERPEFSLQHTVKLQMSRLREQIEWSHKLLHRLEAIASNPSVTVEELMQTMEVITMFEKYYHQTISN